MTVPIADDGTTLDLSGPVTRAEVEWWRGAILEAIVSGQPLRIDLADSGPWDVLGVQLLLSAGVAAERRGVRLVLDRAPRVFFHVVERAGLAAALAPWIREPSG